MQKIGRDKPAPDRGMNSVRLNSGMNSVRPNRGMNSLHPTGA